MAIASSMPPRYEWFLWNTCITTRGRRPSARSVVARVVEVRVGVVALAHLLDREVEDLRWEPFARALLDRHGSGLLELEARGERCLGDLDLLRRRLGRREAMLQLVSRASRAHARAACRGCAPSSRRSPSTPRRQRAARRDARAVRMCAGARAARVLPIAVVASSGAEQVRPAALVFLRARLAVLVLPIEMCSAPWYAATSEPRSATAAGATESRPLRSSCAAGPSFAEPRTSRTAVALPSIAASTAGRWNGNCASGSARRICGKSAIASSSFAGPRSSGLSIFAPLKRLRWATTFSSPSSRADRARPRRRAVDEHAVGERHAAEADLFFGHAPRLAAEHAVQRGAGS